MSFECVVSERLRVAVDGYLHPRNPFLALTDGFFVENKAYYYKVRDSGSDRRMVLIVENGVFDVVAQYVALTASLGILFSLFSGGLQLWSGIFFVSLVLMVVSLSYLSGKVRFFLLRWRVHKVVDKGLVMDWLSKEQVINKFNFGVVRD